MKINYKELGLRLKNARLKNNLTQEKLAEIVNVSSVYISHIENGTAKTSLDVLVNVCNTLNITPDYALTGSIHNTDKYLRKDISEMLNNCPPKTLHLILKIIQTIINEE